jgi:tetratricopeptide (TPR) repeat protein
MDEESKATSLQRYEDLRTAGAKAIHQGRFGEAVPLYAQALRIAREAADGKLQDVAFCNWAAAKIELREMDEVLAPLREILLRSDDPANCRLSAYHISRIYELRGEPRKGLFYARIARDRTAQMQAPNPAWIASNHNLIANFLVADSRFDEALEEYRLALEAQPDAAGYRVPGIRQNVGYCHLMLGRPRVAFPFLFESMRAYRRLRASALLPLNHLDLAYAYLEIDRPRRAIQHAQRALRLAQQHNDEPNVKNALYLLGEAWHLYGDDERARQQFERLSDCYEDLPFIADFLLSVDVRQMISLRA